MNDFISREILALNPSPAIQDGIRNLWSSVNELVSKLNELKTNYRDLLEEFESLRNVHPDNESDFNFLSGRVSELENQNLEFSKLFEDYEEKLESLTSENNELRSAYRELEELRISFADLLRDSEGYKTKAQLYDNQHKKLKEIELLLDQLEEFQAEFDDGELFADDTNQNDSVLNNILNLKNTSSRLISENDELKLQMLEKDRLFEELNKQINELTQQNIGLKDKLNNSEAELQVVNESLLREKEIINTEKNSLADENYNLKNRIEELQLLNNDKTFLENEILEFKNKESELINKLKINEDRNDDLKNTLIDLRNQLINKDIEIENIKSNFLHVEESEQNYTDLLREFESVKSNEIENLSVIASLEGDMKIREQKIAECNETIEALKNRIEELQNAITTAVESNTTGEIEMFTDKENSPAELTLFSDNLKEAKKLNTELEYELENLRDTLTKKDERIAELLQFENEFHRNRSELQNLKNEFSSLTFTAEHLKIERIELENRIYRLTKEKYALNESTQELSEKYQVTADELTKRSEKLAELEKMMQSTGSKTVLPDKQKQLMISKIDYFLQKLEKQF